MVFAVINFEYFILIGPQTYRKIQFIEIPFSISPSFAMYPEGLLGKRKRVDVEFFGKIACPIYFLLKNFPWSSLIFVTTMQQADIDTKICYFGIIICIRSIESIILKFLLNNQIKFTLEYFPRTYGTELFASSKEFSKILMTTLLIKNHVKICF